MMARALAVVVLLSTVAPVLAKGGGLAAIYFDQGEESPEFSGPRRTAIEPQLRFDWSNGAKVEGGDGGRFSARFAGRVMTPAAADGDYKFEVERRGGVRVWVDDQLVVDAWQMDAAPAKGSIRLAGGSAYRLVIEYRGDGVGMLSIAWKPPGALQAAPMPAEALYSDRRLYPASANVLNVTGPFSVDDATYRAAGDGVADDTAALRAAVRLAQNTGRTVYLPSGTYRVTDTIDSDRDRFGSKFLLVQGEQRDNTVIRLDDASSGFADPKKPRALFSYLRANYSNEAFGNSAYDLTFSIGRDNPGAVALRYAANNYGTLHNVTVRADQSADGKRHGRIGIHFPELPGPALIQHVLVEGFDIGAQDLSGDYGLTFEHVTFQDQAEVAVKAGADVIGFRRLRSRNRVPVLDATSSQLGLYTFVDCDFTGGAGGAAIVFGSPWGDAAALLQNVRTDGYAKVIRSPKRQDLIGPNVDFFATTSSPASMKAPRALDVPETPELFWGEAEQWVVVAGKADDDTAALQAAIDGAAARGVEVLALRAQDRYVLSNTVRVHGPLRRLLMNNATVMPSAAFSRSGQALFRIESLTSESLTIDRFWGDFPKAQDFSNFEIATTTPVVIRDGSLGGRLGSAGVKGARLFISDVSAKELRIAPGASVYARQFNPEYANEVGSKFFVDNRGGTLWAFGLKTEGAGSILHTQAAGQSWIYNAYFYPSRPVPRELPAVVAGADAYTFFSGANGGQPGQQYFTVVKRSGGTSEPIAADSKGIIPRGPGWIAPAIVVDQP